jgi:hypothetical protein
MTTEQTARTSTGLELGSTLAPDEERELRQRLTLFHNDVVRLTAMQDSLLAEHDGEWAAMYDGRLFLSSGEEEMFDLLRAAGVDVGRVVVQYLTTQPRLHEHL